MSKHRSIGERLKKAKSLDAKRATMREWAHNITIRTEELCTLAYNAGASHDTDAMREYLRELSTLIYRSMDAVPRITDELIKTQPDTQNSE